MVVETAHKPCGASLLYGERKGIFKAHPTAICIGTVVIHVGQKHLLGIGSIGIGQHKVGKRREVRTPIGIHPKAFVGQERTPCFQFHIGRAITKLRKRYDMAVAHILHAGLSPPIVQHTPSPIGKVGAIVGSKVQHIYLVTLLISKDGVVVRRCNTRTRVFLDGQLLAKFVGVSLYILRRGIYAMDSSPCVDAVLRIDPNNDKYNTYQAEI